MMETEKKRNKKKFKESFLMIQTPKENTVHLDGLSRSKKRIRSFDLPLARFILRNKNSSILYSKKGLAKDFYTRDSKLYFTQESLGRFRRGEKISWIVNKIDSVTPRSYASNQYPDARLIYISRRSGDVVYERIRDRYSSFGNYLKDLINGSTQGMSMTRMWNISMVGALIFGMFLMTMIYRYLGQGVSAESKTYAPQNTASQVLGEATQDNPDNGDGSYVEQLAGQIISEYVSSKNDDDDEPTDFEKKLKSMVKGYPIEKMIPYIAKKDKIVAAFMISIAKKESDWGKHVPVDSDGGECYNDWGFRAQRAKMGTGGHTCFDSPQDAVDSVSRRIEELVQKEKIKTPKDMVVVWKCGYDCSWDNQKNVRKWVSDVEGYFDDVNAISE